MKASKLIRLRQQWAKTAEAVTEAVKTTVDIVTVLLSLKCTCPITSSPAVSTIDTDGNLSKLCTTVQVADATC